MLKGASFRVHFERLVMQGEEIKMVELRWVIIEGGQKLVQQKPTATDALEYANNRLASKEEMDCSKADMRVMDMKNVRDLVCA